MDRCAARNQCKIVVLQREKLEKSLRRDGHVIGLWIDRFVGRSNTRMAISLPKEAAASTAQMQNLGVVFA